MTATAGLQEILNQEIGIYRQLLALARKKGEAIVGKKMEEVNEAQLTEQKLVEQVAELEQKRQQSVKVLCRQHGIEIQDGYVSELTRHIGADGEKIKEAAGQLRAIIEEMQTINENNMKLIQQNIEIIEGALKSVKIKSESKSAYDTKGNRSSASMLFDKKG